MVRNSDIPAISFEDAAFSYGGDPVLVGVTGKVYPGEALALIGPNGSGKTTLLRGVLRTVKVSGTMNVLGTSVDKVKRGRIGYVPQVADLDPTFPVTVRQVVEMGLYGEVGWLRRLTGDQKRRIDAALERVDMLKRQHRRFGDLSGGQKQRVLVARAIVSRPKLILLDEPFNGLDQPNRVALLEIIEAVKDEGVAVIVSTHDLSLAHEVCEKVLLLANRQIGFGFRDDVLVPELIVQAYGGLSSDELINAGVKGADSAAQGATTGAVDAVDAAQGATTGAATDPAGAEPVGAADAVDGSPAEAHHG